MANAEKVAALEEIKKKFDESHAGVVTEYRGLTVAKLQELRRSLKGNAQYTVSKNTLTRIAAKEAGITNLDEHLKGPSAVAFVTGDPVEAAKSLRDFAKDNPELIIKAGYLDGEPLDAAGIEKLANLESREVLLGKLAGGFKASLTKAACLFNAPLSKTVRTVDALRSKVETEGPAGE